jgi:hypothetical protein
MISGSIGVGRWLFLLKLDFIPIARWRLCSWLYVHCWAASCGPLLLDWMNSIQLTPPVQIALFGHKKKVCRAVVSSFGIVSIFIFR